MNITEFLEARIAEDEAVANNAIDPECPGSTWQWVTTATDTVVAPGDLQLAQEEQTVSLRSADEFPTAARPLPFFAIGYAEEVHPGAGEHIARHDPARVLAECAAKRAVIQLCDDVEYLDDRVTSEWGGPNDGTADDILHALAAVYADHQDYRQEWAL